MGQMIKILKRYILAKTWQAKAEAALAEVQAECEAAQTETQAASAQALEQVLRQVVEQLSTVVSKAPG